MASAKHPAAFHGPAVEGEILSDASLTAEEMAHMNFARDEFRKLERLLLKVVLPALGDYNLPISHEVRRHLAQVSDFSGHFCWSHRHLGQMSDAKDVGCCAQGVSHERH